MLRWFLQKLALRSYRRKLGPALIRRYGRELHYTVAQVRKTAETLGLNRDWLCYAYADYCSRDDFDAHHAATGETCSWTEMRHELSTSWGIGHHVAQSHHHGGHDHHGH